MKKKIAILGSCISRDPFTFFPDDRFDIVRFAARTSPISLYSVPLEVEQGQISHASAFEARCIYEDFTKKALSILDEDFDYLILDFIEDRYDLAQIGGSYVLVSPTVIETGILDLFPKRRMIPREDEEVAFLWARSWLQLVEDLKKRNLLNKTILHCGVYSPNFIAENGNLVEFDKFKLRFAEMNQCIINSYHALVRTTAPGIRLICAAKPNRLATSAHRWGLQPFHYIDEYYVDVMQQLRAITKMEEPMLATTPR